MPCLFFLGGWFLRRQHLRNKAPGKFTLAAVLDVKVADDGEDDRADKVDEQVLHRVQQADIQIAAQAQGMLRAVGGDHDYVRDILDSGRRVAPGGIQHDRTNGVYDRVLLHVQQEELVHGALEKFPKHADGHGEAEGHQSQVEGRELEGKASSAVEDVQQRKADGGAQEAVEGVEHGVPIREVDIIRLDLPQNFSGEDEQEDNDLQGIGHVDMDGALDKAGDGEQDQRQDAKKSILKVAVEDLGDQHQHDQHPQDNIGRGEARIFLDLFPQGLAVTTGLAIGLFHGTPPAVGPPHRGS